MSGGNWIAAAALGVLLLPQTARADYWRYETETGGVAFTDDKKSIPTKYQAGAKAVKEESLFDYGRLSVIHPVRAGDATRTGVRATEPAVPVFAWPVNAPVAEAPAEDPDTRVRINVGGMQFDVNSEEGEEPLYVDRGQYTDLEGNYIEHGGIMRPTTIIRRGDVPIAYIDETE